MRITVIAPEEGPAPRALPVAEPFSALSHRERPLAALARELGAAVVRGRVVAVDEHRHSVHLDGGRTVVYDVLVLAVGAAARPRSTGGADALRRRRRARGRPHPGRAGAPGSVDFVVPPGATRALSLYELAVHTGDWRSRARGADAPCGSDPRDARRWRPSATPPRGPSPRCWTRRASPSRAPSRSSRAIDGLLRGSATPRRPARRPTVALPVLDGPSLPGVPATADGFIPVDDHGAVLRAGGRLRRRRRDDVPGQARRRRLLAGRDDRRRPRPARRRGRRAAAVAADDPRAPLRRPRRRRRSRSPATRPPTPPRSSG